MMNNQKLPEESRIELHNNKLGFTVEYTKIPLEVFRYGPLLFRRFWDGWHITGPPEELEKYTEALEKYLKKAG